MRRVGELHGELVTVPLGLDRTARNLAVEGHGRPPKRKRATGITRNPPASATASTLPARRSGVRYATPATRARSRIRARDGSRSPPWRPRTRRRAGDPEPP